MVGAHVELVLEGLPFEPGRPVEELVVSKAPRQATAEERSCVIRSLSQIAAIPPGKKAQVIDIRAGRYVCLEGEGLVILGCIGYELLNYAPDEWREYVHRLGTINWQEEDAIWTSSIRQRTEKIDPKNRSGRHRLQEAVGLFGGSICDRQRLPSNRVDETRPGYAYEWHGGERAERRRSRSRRRGRMSRSFDFT